MYKVTILTSLYKASNHLDSFLKNIVQQTIFDKCELYLMNGNSPESDIEDSIVQQYSHYPNIRYEKLNQDPGIYGCWNKMIENSDSEYITNANVDDKIMPLCLEKHVEVLDKQKEIDVAYCININTYDPNLSHESIREQQQVFPTNHFSIEGLLQSNLPHNHPVWRRSLHDRFGFFEAKKYQSGSDWDFWLRCAIEGVQMQLIPEILGIYYRNPEGMSSKAENMQRNLQEIKEIRNYYQRKLNI